MITAKNDKEDVGCLSNSDKKEKEKEKESVSQPNINIIINEISQTNNQYNNIFIISNNYDKNKQEESSSTEENNSNSVQTQNELTNGNVIGVNPETNDMKEECEFSTSKFENLLNDKIKNKKEVTINIREWLLTQLPKSGSKKTVRGETLAYLIIALEEMEAFSKDISIDACWSAILELKVPIVLSRMIQVKYHDLNETRRNRSLDTV